jgi:hypothetical protein
VNWKDLKNVVGKAAPLIGTVLAGPAGGTVGNMIASVLGVEGTADAVNEALKANPELLVKIKELESNERIELKRLAFQQEQLEHERDVVYLLDRQSARQREIETTKATGERDTNLYLLAWTVLIAFFGTIGVMFWHPIPEGQTEVLFELLGSLATGFGMVLQYFFGSSKGSRQKDKFIAGARNGK